MPSSAMTPKLPLDATARRGRRPSGGAGRPGCRGLRGASRGLGCLRGRGASCDQLSKSTSSRSSAVSRSSSAARRARRGARRRGGPPPRGRAGCAGPNVNGIAAGGATSRAFVPSPWRSGTRPTIGSPGREPVRRPLEQRLHLGRARRTAGRPAARASPWRRASAAQARPSWSAPLRPVAGLMERGGTLGRGRAQDVRIRGDHDHGRAATAPRERPGSSAAAARRRAPRAPRRPAGRRAATSSPRGSGRARRPRFDRAGRAAAIGRRC